MQLKSAHVLPVLVLVVGSMSFVHAQSKSAKPSSGILAASTASAAKAAGKSFETWRGKFATGDGGSTEP